MSEVQAPALDGKEVAGAHEDSYVRDDSNMRLFICELPEWGTFCRVLVWIGRNQELWHELEQLALESTRLSRRFSVRCWAEEVRWRRRVECRDEAYKIDSRLLTVFIRLLLRRHPECAPYLEIRRSAWDCLLPGGGE